MKHTPAPWFLSEDGFIYETTDWRIIADPHCTNLLGPDEREANARLIAKAPEMYNLLKAAAYEMRDISLERLGYVNSTLAEVIYKLLDEIRK
jgi:hypothetical protein